MNEKEILLTLSVEEANTLLEALGNLPFAKVYALVGKVQTQAAGQLEDAAPGADSADSADSAAPEADTPREMANVA